MKTKVLLVTIISFFTVANFVLGQNRAAKDDKEKDNKKGTTSIIINKLSIDVNLTDSQKAEIEARLLKMFERVEAADKKTNKNESVTQKIAANNEYVQFMDSILTDDQKLRLNTKTKERENANNK